MFFFGHHTTRLHAADSWGKWTAASEVFKPIVQDHQIRSEARDGAGLSVNGAFGFLSAAFCNRGVLLVQFVDKLREVSVDAGH